MSKQYLQKIDTFFSFANFALGKVFYALRAFPNKIDEKFIKVNQNFIDFDPKGILIRKSWRIFSRQEFTSGKYIIVHFEDIFSKKLKS